MSSVPLGSTILAIHIAGWVLWATAAVAVCLRFIARLKRKHGYSWDDYFMLLSLVSCQRSLSLSSNTAKAQQVLNLIAGIFASYAASFGAGGRFQDVVKDPADLSSAFYWSNVANTVGLLGNAFPKLAVALLANRVLAPQRFMRVLNITIPSILLVLVVIVIIVIWVCTE